ncbi:MAG TPA: hypothetical protein VE991_03460, partial [Acidimicrobiales bacterium]|nr:hypothetical protein [Acidimicrobiales bacterium]
GALDGGSAQEGEASYAEKLRTEELRLDWTRPAAELRRVVRLDRAFTTFRGRRLLVPEAVAEEAVVPGPPGTVSGTAVATGRGSLRLAVVQPEGKRPMDAEQWVRGLRLAPGERLGADGPEADGPGDREGGR